MIGHVQGQDATDNLGEARFIPKARVDWRRPEERAEGISWGYTTLSRQISQQVTHDRRSRIALHCCPLERFKPIRNKTNILITMHESRDLGTDHVVGMRRADALVVPSKFCRDIFQPHSDCPIHLVPLGVDVERFPYKRRVDPRPNGKFRFMWLASPDPRKGYPTIVKAWQEHFEDRNDVELYLKTTSKGRTGIEKQGNYILDWRNLPRDELAELYYSGHAFLYPSAGEGFGLSLAEAMASGLPAIGTMWSGHADFFNHTNGYPISHTFLRAMGVEGRESLSDDGRYELAIPDRDSLVTQMHKVLKHYKTATTRARTGSNLIHRKYTWRLFRYRLRRVIERYTRIEVS